MTDAMDPRRMDCRDAHLGLRSESARLREDGRVDAASLESVRDHLAACVPCRKRLASRLRTLEARDALRRRAMPDGILDGFFDDIQSRVPHSPAGGAMSLAFLDAPRSLRVWRTTAIAALVVLGVGGAFLVSNRLPTDPSGYRYGEVTLRDLPAGLLPAWERNVRFTSRDERTTPGSSVRGVDPDDPSRDFFLQRPEPPQAVPSSHTPWD